MQTIFNSQCPPINRASISICLANSRVGAITKARGATHPVFLGFGFGLFKSLVNRVIRNAAVFPVPVCACPAISWPESEIGSVFACIEVQYLKSASLMPFRTTSGIGRDSNVIWLNYCSKFWDRESIEFQE